MGVLSKMRGEVFEELKHLLHLKNNEVISLEAGGSRLDLIVKLTPGSFNFELQSIIPSLKEYGNTYEDSQRMLQNHNAISSKVELLRSELQGQLEGTDNHFELKQLLNTAFRDLNDKLNNKKSLLAIKLQASMNGSDILPSLTPLRPSLPESSPQNYYSNGNGTGIAPKITHSPKDKNQKFGLPCTLEVHVMADPEPEVYWYLNSTLLATVTPTTTSNNNKNVTTTKKTTKNNTHVYKLNVENFGHENTGTYTMVARNYAGESSCKCHIDHVSNHSTPRTNQSPMTNRSISREEMHSDHNHPLSSIPENNFQSAPSFIEALHQVDACEGDSVLFKVHVAGNPPPEVRWFREGVEIFNSPDFKVSRDSRFRNVHFLEIPEIFLEDAGRFTCIAYNHLGSSQSTASLVVRAPSEMTSIPGLYSDQSLEDFGFSFTPTSQSASSSVVNLFSNMITTQATPVNTTEECIKPYFKAVSRDLEIGNGKVARFDSVVAGKPAPDVTWLKDDMRLMTDSKYAVVVNEKGVNSLIIKACEPQDSGLYHCIASNKAGQDYFEVRLTVTVGLPTNRYSPTNSMTRLHNAPPTKTVLRNFHSEERTANKFKITNGVRKSDIHSEERSIARRNFYKTTDVKKSHVSLKDNINGRGSPKKFMFSQWAVENSTDESSVGPPQLLQPIDDPDVQEGDCAELACRIFSPGKCFYQWFFNNEPLQSDPKKYEIVAENDRYSLKIWNLSTEDRGFYQCTVANEDGEVTCIGRVNPLGSLISRPGSEIRICKSPAPFNLPSYWSRTIKEVKLSCTVIGRPKPKLTWYIGDEIILSNCKDFETRYDRETGLVELKIRNVEKYLNRKIKCVAENDQGLAETECILTEGMLSDPTFTHPDYSNLLIHQISSKHNLPSFNTAPRFSQRVKPRMVNEGDTVTLSAVIHGRPQPIVKWMKDAETEITPSKKHALIFNEESNVCQLRIFDCQSQDSGTYSCVAYNPNGQTTCSTTIYISPPESTALTFDVDTGAPVTEKLPQFTLHLEPSYTIVPGQPVKFTCRIKREPSIHVTWYFNGIEISSGHVMKVVDGDVISTLSIPHPKPANRGEYSCYVRNFHGATKTTTYLEIDETTISTVQYSTRDKPHEDGLKFSMPIIETHSIALPPNESINRYYNEPPSFTQPLVNHIATEGSEAFFVVKFTGEPPPSIQWFVNGNLISEKNSNYRITTDFPRKESILYLQEVFVGDDGEYTCRAENISGIAYTTSHLHIKTSPRYSVRKDKYIYGSSQSIDYPEDGKPQFNVGLTLVRPEKDTDDQHCFINKEFEIHDERETRRVEMERESYMPPEQAFSETISIDKTDQRVVQVDVPKPTKTSELHIQRPSITSSISEIDIELMKSIDLIPYKPMKPKAPKEFISTKDTENRRIEVESEYQLQPEATFTETVSIDKSEVQEVVFDSLPSKKTSEITVQQEASLKGMRMEAEIILVEEPQNFTETVSIDKSRDHEIEFTVQKPHQTSELTVHQESMPKGSRIEAEILPEKKLTAELVVETGCAPKFLIELVPVNVMDGSPVYFTTKVFASPMPEYVTWYRNEKDCEEIVHIHVDYNIETGVSNLHIAEVFPEDSGRYMCVASNQFGTAKSTATLTVSAYDRSEVIDYVEVCSIESDNKLANSLLIEGKIVQSDFTDNKSVYVQPTHAKVLKTEASANEHTQSFIRSSEKDNAEYSVEFGIVLERNNTKMFPYMANQIRQEPENVETVNEMLEKTLDLRKSPLKWELTSGNLHDIDKKMVIPSLAKVAITKLNVEETGYFVEAIQKDKVDYYLEAERRLERHKSVNMPFMSKQIKKDVCKYETVNEQIDSSGDESTGKVSEISEDYPNCHLITKELCKVRKTGNVSTLAKPSHVQEDSDGDVDYMKEERNAEQLSSKYEPQPSLDKSSKTVLTTLTKQISKSPVRFEAVDETIDSSGYESTGKLSDTHDTPVLGSQYVDRVLSHASVKQKVPALAKISIEKKYDIEVSQPKEKSFMEEKALEVFEPSVAMEKGLSKKPHYRTKQRKKEAIQSETVDAKSIKDVTESIEFPMMNIEVIDKNVMSKSVKNVLPTNVNSNLMTLTLEQIHENVKVHDQQQPKSTFEHRFCSETKKENKTQFRTDQLSKGKGIYETVSNKMDSPIQETFSNVSGLLINSMKSEIITKESCQVEVASSTHSRVNLKQFSAAVENTENLEEARKEEKSIVAFESGATFVRNNLVLIPYLSRQILKGKDTFETVCHTKSLGHETTGKFIDSFDSFANTTAMTTNLLFKAQENPSVLTLAFLAKTKMVQLENIFPFAKLLNEDRANLSLQETSLIENMETRTIDFMTKPLIQRPTCYDSIDNSIVSLSLYSDKLSARDISSGVDQFAYSSKASTTFHSSNLNVEPAKVDCIEYLFDKKPIMKTEVIFEPSFVKDAHSHTRQSTYTAYQYLDEESDAQSDVVSSASIDMRPSERASENYIAKITVMSEPVKMNEYHITPLVECFAEEKLFGTSSDYSSAKASTTLTENNLVNQSSKVFNKTFTPVVKVKDDFYDTVKTLEISMNPEEIQHQEVTVDIGHGKQEPATLLHGASQRVQLNLDRVEELKTTCNSTNLPSHWIPNDLQMSDVSQRMPTFIRSSLDHTKHQEIYGINVDLNFNHTFPDLITANFNKSIEKLNLINHSSSIVDVKKSELVRMMDQPFIKSILSIPEKVAVRLLRLESIDTTLFRTSLLEYLMLLEQEFALKAINLDNQTSVIPYADIVKVETGMASSGDKTKTRLVTNVYFLQLEEVNNVDFSYSTCNNEGKTSAGEEFCLSEKKNLLNHCISQFKTTIPESVVLDALSKISTMLCIPENMVCNIERLNLSDAVLYRASLTEYILLLENVLAFQAFNIDDLAVLLPHSELTTLQTGLAMLKQKPLTRTQANIFFLKLDDVTEGNTTFESFSIQPDLIIKEININVKHDRQATYSLPFASTKHEEMAFEAISQNSAATYNTPLEEKALFSRTLTDDKVLSRVSVSDYVLLLERIMALSTFNIDDSAMNLPTPDVVLLQTVHASQQDQPLTRVQPNLFYLQLERANDLNTTVQNADAEVSQVESEIMAIQNKTSSLSRTAIVVDHKNTEQISENMILSAISNVSNAFCKPQNVVCKIDRAQKSNAILYRAPLADYVMLLERMLPLHSLDMDALAVMLPQAELTLLQTSIAMLSQRPLNRSQPHLYLLRVDNVIEKDMSFGSFSIKPQHIIKEIAKAIKKHVYSHSPSRTHHKESEQVQPTNVSTETKDRKVPDFIKMNFNNITHKDKVLSRASVSEYKLLMEKLMALTSLNIEDSSVSLPMPDLVLLQTFYASCENKPSSRVQPNLLSLTLEEVSKHDTAVEKSTAQSSETKVCLDFQSAMTKVKEYFLEPKEEVVEKEDKPTVNKPRKKKPEDEEYFEDMFESWETRQKTEITIESDNESDVSTESMYEEWEFTTVNRRLVEEEFPTKRNVVEVIYPESSETTVLMESSRNSASTYTDETDFRTQTSFDRSMFCTDMFNRIVRKNVDESYKRPTFEQEITTSELIKNHSIALTTAVSAIPEPEIEWYKDGIKIVNSRHFSTYYGDGACKLTIHKFTPRYSGRYACRAVNEVGMNETFIVLDYDFFEAGGEEVDKTYDHMTFEESFMEIKEEWMNVVTEEISYKSLEIPTAPTFEQEISSITVVDGSDVTLYCKLLSFPEARIEWYFRNQLIKQSRDFSMGYKNDYCYLVIREAMPHDQGEYTVKAYNEHGSSQTSIYLTILDTYELSEAREVQTRSSRTERSYKASSLRSYETSMKAEKLEKSSLSSSKELKSKRTESKSLKKTSTFVDSDEEVYSSGEESIEMWTVEEWLFYDYKKYYNADVFMKKRDDYLEYYTYVPYDEKSFMERICSIKAALSDKHAFRFPVIIKELPILEVFEGKRVQMECVIEARPEAQITWFKNGRKIVASEHVSLTFENNVARLSIEQALLDDEAEYRCEARNEYGSSFTWGQLYVETVQLRWGRIKDFKIVRKKFIL